MRPHAAPKTDIGAVRGVVNMREKTKTNTDLLTSGLMMEGPDNNCQV